MCRGHRVKSGEEGTLTDISNLCLLALSGSAKRPGYEYARLTKECLFPTRAVSFFSFVQGLLSPKTYCCEDGAATYLTADVQFPLAGNSKIFRVWNRSQRPVCSGERAEATYTLRVYFGV